MNDGAETYIESIIIFVNQIIIIKYISLITYVLKGIISIFMIMFTVGWSEKH